MNPRLDALIDELRAARTPLARLRVLGRGWRTIRQMSLEERRLLAMNSGVDGAEEIVERISRKNDRLRPAMLLRALDTVREEDPQSLQRMLRDLGSPDGRRRLLRESVTRLEESAMADAEPSPPSSSGVTPAESDETGDGADDARSEPRDEATDESGVGGAASIRKAGAMGVATATATVAATAAATSAGAVVARAVREETADRTPASDARSGATGTRGTAAAARTDSTVDEDRTDLSSGEGVLASGATADRGPAAGDTATAGAPGGAVRVAPPHGAATSPAGSRVVSTALRSEPVLNRLVERLSDEPRLIGRLRMVREVLESVEAPDTAADVDWDAVLGAFEPSWARRRALSAILAAGFPCDFSRALALIETLERESGRRWCRSTLRRRTGLSADQRAQLDSTARARATG